MIVFLLFLWILISFLLAKYLIRTNQIDFQDLQEISNQKVENIEFKTIDNHTVSAWILKKNSQRIIILLSGIQGNRLSQISRAEFYLKMGFSVFMPDLRGSGKTKGKMISFGWHERKDLSSCVVGLHQMGYTNVSVDGHSLGAATAVYSLLENVDFEFIILESCYDNITNAFKNRVNKYHLPYFLFRPIEYFTQFLIGVSKNDLAPEKIIKNVKCPILFLAGDSEIQIPIVETETLFKNCNSKLKKIHFFKGAKHEDFHKKFKTEFEMTVTNFVDSMIYPQ